MADNVPLRDYLEARIEAVRVLLDQRFDQADANTVLARQELGRRLEQLNELRADVVKDRSEYVRGDVFDGRMKALEDKTSALDNWRSKAMGAAAVLAVFSGVIGATIARLLSG